MATQLVITGTGAPVPAPGRAGSGVLVRAAGHALQFDAGRATTLRLVEAGTPPAVLDAVFVTHHHSDHVSGLADVLLTRWLHSSHGNRPTLPVVAPAGPAGRFVERMLEPYEEDIAVRMEHSSHYERPSPVLSTFDAGSPQQVWHAEGVTVTAHPVRHEPVVPAVGYRITTGDGVIAISGDTRVCDELAELSNGADILVAEAFRVAAVEPLLSTQPHWRLIAGYHADSVELGSLARAAGISTLVLTHCIPQFPPDDHRSAGFVEDVRRGGYEGRVTVARDLDLIELPAAR